MIKKFLTLLLVCALSACAAPTATPVPTPMNTAAAGPLEKIRLPMGYIPSVQYAPFYVAVENGYFKAENIEIEFDYSFETNGVQLVGAKELPFAVVSGEQVLLARAQGLPVVYVFAWFQKFPVAIIAKTSANIKTATDLKGKRIGVPTLDGANFIGLHALLAKADIKAEDVTIQALGFNQAAALSAGQVDAVVVYANNEPIRLAAQGEALDVISISEYATLAANGLMTNEDTIANNPELIRRFNRALQHGIADTFADPDGAYTISKKYAELTDDTLEKQVLLATMQMWKADHVGTSDATAWSNMLTTLLDTQLLKDTQDVTKAYTNTFVP